MSLYITWKFYCVIHSLRFRGWKKNRLNWTILLRVGISPSRTYARSSAASIATDTLPPTMMSSVKGITPWTTTTTMTVGTRKDNRKWVELRDEQAQLERNNLRKNQSLNFPYPRHVAALDLRRHLVATVNSLSNTTTTITIIITIGSITITAIIIERLARPVLARLA